MQWARADEREAKRKDRREENTGGEELNAYNAMFKNLADGKRVE